MEDWRLTSIGILAALLSAVSQAIAHALLKSGADKLIVRGVIGATGMLAMLPVCFLVPLPPPVLLPWLVLSSAIHAIYQLVLIRAYDRQDFSVAYPLARGVVPLATSLLGLVFLREGTTVVGWVGIVGVTAGLLSLAVSRSPSAGGIGAALLAGLLTTAYTLVDAKAVRLAEDAWTFIAWFFVLDGIVMMTIGLVARGRRSWGLLIGEGRRGIAAGIASLITYGSALVALRHLPAGSVSALRETSVVFGAIIAFAVLGEHLPPKRLFGILLIAAGGILCAVGLSR